MQDNDDEQHPVERAYRKLAAQGKHTHLMATYRVNMYDVSTAITASDGNGGRVVVARGRGRDWEAAEDDMLEQLASIIGTT